MQFCLEVVDYRLHITDGFLLLIQQQVHVLIYQALTLLALHLRNQMPIVSLQLGYLLMRRINLVSVELNILVFRLNLVRHPLEISCNLFNTNSSTTCRYRVYLLLVLALLRLRQLVHFLLAFELGRKFVDLIGLFVNGVLKEAHLDNLINLFNGCDSWRHFLRAQQGIIIFFAWPIRKLQSLVFRTHIALNFGLKSIAHNLKFQT